MTVIELRRYRGLISQTIDYAFSTAADPRGKLDGLTLGINQSCWFPVGIGWR
jgi:hypothetical protein